MTSKERLLSLEMSDRVLLNKLKLLERECRDNRNVAYLQGNRGEATSWGYLADTLGRTRSAIARERRGNGNGHSE